MTYDDVAYGEIVMILPTDVPAAGVRAHPKLEFVRHPHRLYSMEKEIYL